MRLEQLRELYVKHRRDRNYRCRDWSEGKLQGYADKSFSRLSQKQQKQVLDSWAELLVREKDENIKENITALSDELKRLRFLCQTNLFFLCHVLEKYNQTTIYTHEEICNAFFVQKDPTFPTFEHFANQYSDLKDRLLLVPRGGFKSSIDMADCVQWTICYPAITMLILTGVYQLAKDFVGEVRNHFTLEETGEAEDDKKKKAKYGPRKLMNRESGEWSESMFQVLFPEHGIVPDEGTALEYQTPAVKEEKEPTLRAASIEQALSGMHVGVLKLDDVVTNENSQTITRLDAVNKQISINRAMLHPYGFMDVIGTWYDEQDFYGITIKSEEELAKEQGSLDLIHGSVDSGRFDSSVTMKILLRAAWWPTEESHKAGKIEAEMKEADWELWFPERLTYKFLTSEARKPNSQFAIKYLNNPRVLNKVKFPRELMMRRTIPHSQLPQQGLIVTTVDTAYSTKDWADYTVIMTSLIFGGRFYIINMVRGRFNEYELPQVIAATAHKWKPKRIAIEDSVGVKWMSRELRREMDKLQISVPVEFVPLGVGNKTKSKMWKAKPVARLLGDERMFFMNSCEGLAEIYTELEKFTGTSADTHDDIVSALSLLAEQFGAYADMESKVSFAGMQYVMDRNSKERHDQMYCLGRYAQFNTANDDNPTTLFQVERAAMHASEGLVGELDPLAELM